MQFEAIFAPDDLIDGTEIFIGRAQDCHLVIDDPQVSRHHAVLVINNGKVVLKKLSKFGDLLLNGNTVNESILDRPSQLLIGEHLLEINELSISVSNDIVIKNNLEEVSGIEDEASTQLDSSDELSDNPDDLVDDSVGDSIDELDSSSDFETNGTNDTGNSDDYKENDDFLADENQSDQSVDFNEESSIDGSDGNSSFSEDSFSEDSEFGNDASFDDEGFGNNDGGFGAEDDSESTQVFQSFASYSLKIFGEYAPFDTFKIEDNEIFIGRDADKCQIVLNDSEVSSVHAKIKKSLINCVIEDLNSSNGTILNGDRINKSELTNGDEFVIGETTFTVQISSDVIEAEKDTLMPVQENQEVEVVEEVEEEVEFENFSEDDGFALEEEAPKSLIQKILKDPKKKRMAIIGVVALLVLFLFDTEETDTKKEDGAKTKVTKDGKVQGEKSKGEGSVKGEEKGIQKSGKVLSPQVKEQLEQNYALALAKYEAAEYSDAKLYLDTVRSIDPDYKNSQTLLKLVNQGYEELTRLKKEEQEEKERQKRALEIKKLVDKARQAVEKREVQISRNYFTQILEKDPENIDVPQLKMIIDAHVKEIEDKKMAEEQAKIRRQNMVEALKPAKTLFLRGDWYEAIGSLEKYTKKDGIDEDLVTEATNMLKEARQKLSGVVNPLIGRARSFREGQDLKRAYETFGEVLKYQPTNEEALNERQEIKESLDTRSRKIYREALISESLSLFNEAKEKFQEVQQVSPVGSEYYIKASNKLKEYLE